MDEPIIYYIFGLEDVLQKPRDVLEEIWLTLLDDNKDEFLNLIKASDVLERYCHVIDAGTVFEYDAVNCATALLNGEIEGFLDFKEYLVDLGVTPLHLAALFAAPRLTKLLLDRGDNIDAKCNFEFHNLKLTGGTPLDMAIERIQSDGLITYWTPHKSIFELLVRLCLLSQRQSLETVRLLIQSTPDKEHVQQKFIKYAEGGKLVQAGVLLMAAPELLLPSCLFLRNERLHEILNHKVPRTEIEEGLALLLDAFALIGDKLVAYIRLNIPDDLDIYDRGITAKELAYLLREAVYDNQSVCHADEYFFRFFKPVLMYEAAKGNNTDRVYFKHGMAETGIVGFPLLRANISLGYINRMFPSLQPEDAVRLTSSIEKKLATSSTLRHLPACIGKSERGELTLTRIESKSGFPFVTTENWSTWPLFNLRQAIPRLFLGASYSTSTSISPLPGDKLMGQSKLKSLFSTMNVGVTKIISVAKRLAK